MQTPEIAKYRESLGWLPVYCAVKEHEKIVAAALLLAKPSFMGKSIYLVPGGPLLDLENTKLVKFFFKNLKSYAKSHNGYVLNISPYYELIERDRHGEIVPDGFSHQKALKNLEELGFRPVANASQPKYLFALDLNNRTAEKLMADFKNNTRYYVHRAERMGVKIRELKKSELSELKKITEATSKRRNFDDHPLDYYEAMYDLFATRDEAKFIIAEAEIKGQVVPLSTAMFILYGDEIVYLFSGSEEKYMHDYNAQYLIQWYMIKYAADHHFKRYNFYGIKGLPDPKSKDYGIYGFKKGFGGQVIELIGTFETPLSNLYYLHRLLSKLKNN